MLPSILNLIVLAKMLVDIFRDDFFFRWINPSHKRLQIKTQVVSVMRIYYAKHLVSISF